MEFPMELRLGEAEPAVRNATEEWRKEEGLPRLWSADASLWTGRGEERWLGWLRVLEDRGPQVERLEAVAREARAEGFRHAVVLGMGGSSLCPDVLAHTFGAQEGAPELLVLDSTVPAQIRALRERLDPARTLFVVSSKSGTTIEPNTFQSYFWNETEVAVGKGKAGIHFLAVTDPGTQLEELARREGFRFVAHGVPSIGGRFSALSAFGMLPAALMGLDVRDFLDRAERMARACGPDVPPASNPGAQLGLVLGTLAQRGRNKLTLVASPGIASLGAWIEQLVAESTGKEGTGIVPVDREAVGPPGAYGDDRVFVQIRLERDASPEQDRALDALAEAGHPVVRIALADTRDLGAELFRWEIATAVAGALLGIDPFDQPDVEAAKVAARERMQAFESDGKLPDEAAFLSRGELALYADERNTSAIVSNAEDGSLEAALRAHLARLAPGDYFAVNAFLHMSEENDRELQAIRHAVRDAKRVATTLGYGPRFLHSTGQLHKGGANQGVFLELTADDEQDLPIPGHGFHFGVLKQAQALGDFHILGERRRRALRVHLRSESTGLRALREALSAALGS